MLQHNKTAINSGSIFEEKRKVEQDSTSRRQLLPLGRQLVADASARSQAIQVSKWTHYGLGLLMPWAFNQSQEVWSTATPDPQPQAERHVIICTCRHGNKYLLTEFSCALLIEASAKVKIQHLVGILIRFFVE